MTMLRGHVTFKGLVSRAKNDVLKDARKVTDPEGDIQPRVYLYAPEWQGLHVHDIPFAAFNPNLKDELVARIVALIKGFGLAQFEGQHPINLVALRWIGYMAWYDFSDLSPQERDMVINDLEVPERIPQPSQRPDRQEIVQVLVVDPEITESWYCPITRRPGRPPRFGTFTQIPRNTEIAGHMITPIQEALR